MGFRGFDIGPGINHYADLMAQGQKDQMDLQRLYAQQQQAQADKEFNRQMLQERTNALYGMVPDPDNPGQMITANELRSRRSAETTRQLGEQRVGATKSEGQANRGLKREEMVASGKDAPTAKLKEQIANEKSLAQLKQKQISKMAEYNSPSEEDIALQGQIAQHLKNIEDLNAQIKGTPASSGVAPMVPKYQANPAQAANSAPSGQVLVKMKDGSTHYIPQDKVSDAVQKYGAVVVGQ